MKTTLKQFLCEQSLDPKLEFHDELNIAIWDDDELRPEISTALFKISAEFIKFLGISERAVKDVILTGSNCNFNYVEGVSDIDLHIVVDETDPSLCLDCPGDFIQDCFWAKKSLWNMEHNIEIKGSPVELYVQPANDNLVAAGIYSLEYQRWIKIPKKERPTYDNISVVAKADDLAHQIDELIDNKSDSLAAIDALKEKIHRLRQTGLSTGSEFSVENLAFKVLRNNGYLDKLQKYEESLWDKSLSVE